MKILMRQNTSWKCTWSSHLNKQPLEVVDKEPEKIGSLTPPPQANIKLTSHLGKNVGLGEG